MLNLFQNFTKKDFFNILICLILIVLQVYLELKMPEYMSAITRIVQMEGTKISAVLKEGTYMLLCAFGSLISAIIVGFFATSVSSNFSATLREKVFHKVLAFNTEEIKKFSTSSLITRTTNDITQIETLISIGLQMIVKAPILAIWAILKIINKGFEWSLLVAIFVLILLTVIGILIILVLPRFEKVQKLIDKINSITRENISGIRVIRAFNAEEYQLNRFETTNRELTNIQQFIGQGFALLFPTIHIIMQSLTLGICLIGAYLINAALMSEKIPIFSNMVVFSSYGTQVISAFLMLAFIFMIWPRASVSARRINEVLTEKVSITSGNFMKKTKEVGTIEFVNVSFKYPDADEYILKNISFKTKLGDTIAFIGSTGSGKSTLINLVPRFYDATDGEILIDGINIKDYDLTTLHNKIGYVPSKAVLFTGTVKSNVSYGKSNVKITEETIKNALEIAQGTDFVLKMDGKYNAHIARGGTNISGGQKQRLAIARAIARNPEIYIFDDAFSALDYKTDSILRQELKKYTKTATCIIVAQRIGTIMNADKIIVLDKGQVVGEGTHKELLKKCAIYKEIALSQISEEELEKCLNKK